MAIDIGKIKQAKKVFDSRTEEKTKEKKLENQRKETERGERNLQKLQEVLSAVQSPDFEKWLETQLIEITEYYGDVKYKLVFKAETGKQGQPYHTFSDREDWFNVSIEFIPFYSERYRYCYRGMAFRTYSQYDILDQEIYEVYAKKRKNLMEEINQTILEVFTESNIKVKSKFEESDSKIIYSYNIQV